MRNAFCLSISLYAGISFIEPVEEWTEESYNQFVQLIFLANYDIIRREYHLQFPFLLDREIGKRSSRNFKDNIT